MPSLNDFPEVPENVVLALEKLFPERSAGPKDSLVELHRYGGKCELIRFLRVMYERQQEK